MNHKLNELVELSDEAGLNAKARYEDRPGRVVSIYEYGSIIEIGVAFSAGVVSDTLDADAWFAPHELRPRTSIIKET